MDALYSPFGEPLRKDVYDSAIADNAFKFSTKFTDSEAGLINYWNRVYSPTLGRFVSRDPIGERGGVNLYAFCSNDGINHHDYLGYYNSNINRLQNILKPRYFPIPLNGRGEYLLIGEQADSNLGVAGVPIINYPVPLQASSAAQPPNSSENAGSYYGGGDDGSNGTGGADYGGGEAQSDSSSVSPSDASNSGSTSSQQAGAGGNGSGDSAGVGGQSGDSNNGSHGTDPSAYGGTYILTSNRDGTSETGSFMGVDGSMLYTVYAASHNGQGPSNYNPGLFSGSGRAAYNGLAGWLNTTTFGYSGRHIGNPNDPAFQTGELVAAIAAAGSATLGTGGLAVISVLTVPQVPLSLGLLFGHIDGDALGLSESIVAATEATPQAEGVAAAGEEIAASAPETMAEAADEMSAAAGSSPYP